MNYKINYLILFTSIFLVSCIEEIDLVEFTDEFGAYEPELRVEALMLPHDNTAIIRIDRSISIDDESLFVRRGVCALRASAGSGRCRIESRAHGFPKTGTSIL